MGHKQEDFVHGTETFKSYINMFTFKVAFWLLASTSIHFYKSSKICQNILSPASLHSTCRLLLRLNPFRFREKLDLSRSMVICRTRLKDDAVDGGLNLSNLI